MESSQEKTEQPTPKKILDARKEGNVAYSRDVSMLSVLIVMFSGIYILRYGLSKILANNYLSILELINERRLDLNYISLTALDMLKNSIIVVVGLIILAASFAAFTTVVQMGGILVKDKPIKLDLKKFNPVNNFKQIFGKKSWIKFFLNCCKVSLMFLISYVIIKQDLRDILLFTNLQLPVLIYYIFITIFKFIAIVLSAYFIFGIVDYFIERRNWYKQLMMSLEEIKKEDKETNGNPEIKYHRREMHREILEDDFMDNYKGSMLVLANPTHIAIGIVYMPKKWKLPIILFKLKGSDAQSRFIQAKRHDIPIIRDKWLARNLYQIGEVNKFVPQSMAKNVAWIIGNNLHLLPQIKEDISEQQKNYAEAQQQSHIIKQQDITNMKTMP